MRLTYSTQLNAKPRIFKFFTPWEFFAGMLIVMTPVFLPMLFGLDPSLLDIVVVGVAYSCVIIFFKVGKPEGYLAHLLKHLVTPTEFRPGHKEIVYPIKPDEEAYRKALKRTREELWDSARETQRVLLDANIMPIGRRSTRYIPIGDDMKEAAKAFVDDGGVLGVGTEQEFKHKRAANLL